MYPDEWVKFCKMVNVESSNTTFTEEKQICQRYFEHIKNKNQKFIDSWFDFEDKIIYTNKSNQKKTKEKNKYELAFYESYFYAHNFFVKPHFIEQKCHKIKKICGYFVHGRIDIVCDFYDSWFLHQKLPKSQLVAIDYNGHWGKQINLELKKIFNELGKKYYKKRATFYY